MSSVNLQIEIVAVYVQMINLQYEHKPLVYMVRGCRFRDAWCIYKLTTYNNCGGAYDFYVQLLLKSKARRLIEQESFVNNRTIGVSVAVNKKSSLLDFE